jgi:hypothetical protein
VEGFTHPEKAILRIGDPGNILEFDQDLFLQDLAAATRPVKVIILAREGS